MKRYFLGLLFSLFTIITFAQERNFRLVKSPTENPTNQQRKAVVIGMSDYGEGKRLNNTLNDADDMAEVLTQLGFEVTLLKNNDLRNLEINLTNWYNNIEGNDMAIFYFAGHGMEVNGENYLIPVDAQLTSETDVKYNALNVNQVLGNMDERKVSMKLLILDACRNNPFKRSWSRGSEEKGLAQMAAPQGTYIAFAASPGFTAQDGGDFNLKNGVFTYYLKQEILKAGFSIDEIFNKVTGDVASLTHNQQTPFKNSSLTNTFYFKPKANPQSGENLKKYYYYVDESGNRSAKNFDKQENAESEMKVNKLYGKIYSNTGEVFLIESPAAHLKPAIADSAKNEIQKKLTKADWHMRAGEGEYYDAFQIYQDFADEDLDTAALYNLGVIYEKGTHKWERGRGDIGFSIDPLKAMNWYDKAADKGSIRAAMKIAPWLERGKIPINSNNLSFRMNTKITQDYTKAKSYYQKAADAGNSNAMEKLGELYESGHGVMQDYAQAKYWYQKAADNGNRESQKKLKDWKH